MKTKNLLSRFTAICIIALCTVGAAFAQPAFYYSFDETLVDATENPYTLTSPNGHSFADGRYGKALSLNGTNQYLDLDVNGIVNTGTTPYTVCAWVYDESTVVPTQGNGAELQDGAYFRDEILLAQKDGDGNGRIVLYTRLENPTSGGEVRYLFNNFLGNKRNPSTSGLFERGKWKHVAVLCDPASREVTYYVDGVKDITVSTNAFEACTGGFRIGGHKAGKDYWHGKIDELYLFTSLLSESDVRKVKNNTYFYTSITDRAGLEAINSNLSGNYVLDNDIDLSGSNWTPLGNFTGTLDGNGHIISGLTIDDKDAAALFTRIQGNALVKNLGFENASVTDAAHSRTAILAAFMEGSAVIENCYIANSYIKGRWCVGSFVGRATNITDNGTAAIRNCHSSAYIFVPYHSDNAGMTGGIIGNIYDGNKIIVENCYFSGVIDKDPATVKTEGSIAGIAGWIGKDDSQTISGYTIQNNVNLSPYLLSDDGNHRISSTRSDENVNAPTPGPNYSLASTIVSTYNDWGNTSAIVTTGTATNKDGLNIPDGDANAKAQAFYAGIGWDFNDTWQIDEGNSYPSLKWTDATHPSFVVVNSGAISLSADETVDLTKLIFSGRGLELTFTPESDRIKVEDGIVSFNGEVLTVETVTVSVQEGTLTPAYSLQINLVPEYIAISTPADLEQLRTLPTAKYVLTADLDMSEIANFTPLPNFTGTLDGDNHIISNLTISNIAAAALFNTVSGNAVVKNLGFENASVTTDNANHARTAVLAAFMEGSAVIENCYIANSVVKGRWCVGSFVGRAQNTNNSNAAIRNCYSSAYVYTFATGAEGTGHIGGIIGNIFDNSVTVENCYFSGIIQKELNTHSSASEGQVAGIVGWNGKGAGDQENVSGTIKNNVNLAPYLLSNDGKRRIAGSCKDQDGGDPAPGPNYSLSTTVVSAYNDWGNTSAIVTTGTATNKDGENIPNGDENAKVQDFYETTLGWDFDDVWTMSAGGYPVFSWEKDTTHFVAVPKAISLTSKTTVDLSKYIFSGRGLGLTFGTESEKISVEDGVVSFAQAVTEADTVTVSVREGSLTESYSLQIALVPDYILSIGTFTGGSVTADKAVYAEGDEVTLTITTEDSYEFESISAYKTGDEETLVTLSGEDNGRTFTMPAYGVTVTATFSLRSDLRTQSVPQVTVTAESGEIRATFEGTAAVKLYSMTGILLDEAVAAGLYTCRVPQGVYVLNIAGQPYKVIVK